VCLVGWVDLVTERVLEGIEAVGLTDVAVDDDLDVALGKWLPDFVVDVAPPEAHHEVTRRCLARGVPVLGEKPIASSLDEARDLVEFSRRTETLFVVSRTGATTGACRFRRLVLSRLGVSVRLVPIFTAATTLKGSAKRWPAHCCWIWQSTPLTPLAISPVRMPGAFTVRSSTRHGAGTAARPRQRWTSS